jgi:hypothetical protein
MEGWRRKWKGVKDFALVGCYDFHNFWVAMWCVMILLKKMFRVFHAYILFITLLMVAAK